MAAGSCQSCIAAFAALCTAAVSAGQPVAVDWEAAVAGFALGEQASPMVFTIEEAARCSGRWKLHADAVADGTFPDAAHAAFIPQLRLPDAMHAVYFFLVDDTDHRAARGAADAAERVLAQALSGDAVAAYIYFENLGLCSTQPEAAKEDPEGADETPATTA